MDLFALGDHGVKMKEIKKIDKFWDLTTEQKNLWNMKLILILIIIWHARNSPQRLRKDPGGIVDYRNNQDHTDHSIVNIGLNTQKIPRNLGRLAVTQSPAKDQQLTLIWKTHKERNDYNIII